MCKNIFWGVCPAYKVKPPPCFLSTESPQTGLSSWGSDFTKHLCLHSSHHGGTKVTPDPSKPIRCFLQGFQEQGKRILAKLGCSLEQQGRGLGSYEMVSFPTWMEKH